MTVIMDICSLFYLMVWVIYGQNLINFLITIYIFFSLIGWLVGSVDLRLFYFTAYQPFSGHLTPN